MSNRQVFRQSILINTSPTTVERCLTDVELMHRWLNPLLRCVPVGDKWETEIGSRSRFTIEIPFFKPALDSVIIERKPGLIVWEFTGFFQGIDRWECLTANPPNDPINISTHLINQFEFTIPNQLVAIGFHLFAANFTKADQKAQLQRLKAIAETYG